MNKDTLYVWASCNLAGEFSKFMVAKGDQSNYRSVDFKNEDLLPGCILDVCELFLESIGWKLVEADKSNMYLKRGEFSRGTDNLSYDKITVRVCSFGIINVELDDNEVRVGSYNPAPDLGSVIKLGEILFREFGMELDLDYLYMDSDLFVGHYYRTSKQSKKGHLVK